MTKEIGQLHSDWSIYHSVIFPFIWFTHIEDNCVVLHNLINEFWDSHRIVFSLPILNRKIDMTNYIDVPDSVESGNGILKLCLVITEKNNPIIRTDKSSNPISKPSVKANTQTSLDYSFF